MRFLAHQCLLLTKLTAASLCTLSATLTSVSAEDLRISVWGSPFLNAYGESVVKEWNEQRQDSGRVVHNEDAIQRLIQGNIEADVVALSVHDVQQACQMGILEKFDKERIEHPEDLYAKSVLTCGIASTGVTKSIVYSSNAAEARLSVEQFLDTEIFAGKRGLMRSPVLAMELALLADGVPAHNVYLRLATNDGVEQALNKLTGLRDQIQWWWTPQEAVDMITNGKVDMTTMWDFIYKGQPDHWKQSFRKTGPVSVEFDYLAVPVTSQRKDLAADYIGFASSVRGMNVLAPALGEGYLLPRWSQSTFSDVSGNYYACSSGACPCKGGGCSKSCCESSVPLSLVSACTDAGTCGCPGGGCSESCCGSVSSPFSFDWAFWVQNGSWLGEQFQYWMRKEAMY